jgi:hypothetical protein
VDGKLPSCLIDVCCFVVCSANFVFQDYGVQMKTKLERGEGERPLDHAVDDVLPSVLVQLNGLYTEMRMGVRDETKDLGENFLEFKMARLASTRQNQ